MEIFLFSAAYRLRVVLIIALCYMLFPLALYGSDLHPFNYLLLSVGINGQAPDEVVQSLQAPDEKLFLDINDLERWRITLPDTGSIAFEGNTYYPIDNLEGVTYEIDTKQSALYLTIPALHFEPNQITLQKSSLQKPTHAFPGVIFDYTTLAQQDNSGHRLTGVFTPAYYNGETSIESGFLGSMNYYTDNTNDSSSNDNSRELVRLNTTWREDSIDHMTSMIMGDSYTSTGLWGNAVGFGGFQWMSNYNLQPGFTTYPLPSVQGAAVLPSTIDLYAAGLPVGHTSVDNAGLFTINSIPTINGSGMLEVVTTDLLGRQQVISIPYYMSSQLLRKGLSQYSYEAGFVRENFSMESNDYGPLFTTFTHRTGLTERFTAGIHGEIAKDQQAFGLEAGTLLGNFAELSLAGAVSNSKKGDGLLGEIGIQRQTFNGFSYGFLLTGTTHDFFQLGDENYIANNQSNYISSIDETIEDSLEDDSDIYDEYLNPSSQALVFLGLPSFKGYSAGFAYTQQNNRDSDHLSLVNINLNKSFFKDVSVNFTTLIGLNNHSNNSLFLSVNMPLGRQTYVSTGVINQQEGGSGEYVQVNKSLDIGPDWGYNVYAQQGEQKNYQASLLAQNNVGSYSLTAAKFNDDIGYQAQASGALVFLDDNVFATRDIYDSFALIRLPGYEGLPVFVNGQEVGVTDDEGNAFAPNLVSYQPNTISVEADDLPIEVSLESNKVNVIPYYHNGVVVDFPIKSTQSAIARLELASGISVPAGALVEKTSGSAGSADFVVDDGEVYINNLAHGVNQFVVRWNESTCNFKINYTKTSDPLPDLGSIICQ